MIRQEIGPRLARLRSYNSERDGLLGEETREVLVTLEPYLHLFPIPGGEEGEGGSEKKECHRETCSICNLANCPACKLSLFLQNPDAVRAIRVCAFGRKKKHEDWPEACAWLDPEPGSEWEARWRREGNEILRDRASVQRCNKNKKARLSAESENSERSEYSRGSTGATSVASDKGSHLEKSSAAESLRDEYSNDGDTAPAESLREEYLNEEETAHEETAPAESLREEYLNEEETAHEETADREKTWAEDFPVEEYTNKVNAGIFGFTRGTSARRESFANMEDSMDQYPKFTRSTSVSRGPLSHMEDIKPRRLRSVRGTCAPKEASFPNEAELTQDRSNKVESLSNEAELTQHRSSTVDYDTFLSKMRSGAEGKEDVTDGDEEGREARAAAWARAYEQLTGECAQTEWCRPGQPSHDYETVEETPFF